MSEVERTYMQCAVATILNTNASSNSPPPFHKPALLACIPQLVEMVEAKIEPTVSAAALEKNMAVELEIKNEARARAAEARDDGAADDDG